MEVVTKSEEDRMNVMYNPSTENQANFKRYKDIVNNTIGRGNSLVENKALEKLIEERDTYGYFSTNARALNKVSNNKKDASLQIYYYIENYFFCEFYTKTFCYTTNKKRDIYTKVILVIFDVE